VLIQLALVLALYVSTVQADEILNGRRD